MLALSNAWRTFWLVSVALSVGMGGCRSKEGEGTQSTMLAKDLYGFELKTLEGDKAPLSAFSGKVLLIVNVASECGYTPQYSGLQTLHERYAGRGLIVMGIPSNDFGGQEPGSSQEIRAFCSSKFHVSFPMFEKVAIKGDDKHPLYQWLTAQKGTVGWNFNKFLIDKKGKLVERFDSGVAPLDRELTLQIEKQLGI